MWIFVDVSMIHPFQFPNQLLETDVLCHFLLEKTYIYKSKFDSVPYSILHALHAPCLIHFIFCLSAFSTLIKHKMIFVQCWMHRMKNETNRQENGLTTKWIYLKIRFQMISFPMWQLIFLRKCTFCSSWFWFWLVIFICCLMKNLQRWLGYITFIH